MSLLTANQLLDSVQVPDTSGGESSAGANSVPESSDSSEDLGINWEMLAGSEDDLEGDALPIAGEGPTEPSAPEIPPAAPAPAAPAATPAPGTPAPAPAQQTQPPAVQPSVQTPAPQAPAPQAAQPAIQPTPDTQPQVPDYATWRTNQLGALQQEYALSDEDANAMLTEPETVLPKLAASLHVNVVEHVMRSVFQALPSLMENYTQSTQLNTRAKDLFYQVNDDLKDPAYEPAIMQVGQMYRSVNKTATPEEAAFAIGNLARMTLGLPVRQAPGTPTATPAPAATVPAAPVARPFAPARGGSGGVAPVAADSDNPFTRLANEFLMEDEEGA